MVNSVNHDDQSPLLLACMAAKQDCIETLLEIGADLAQNGLVPAQATPKSKSVQMQCAEAMCKVYPDHLDNSAIKFGGSPLHWYSTMSMSKRPQNGGTFSLFCACVVSVVVCWSNSFLGARQKPGSWNLWRAKWTLRVGGFFPRMLGTMLKMFFWIFFRVRPENSPLRREIVQDFSSFSRRFCGRGNATHANSVNVGLQISFWPVYFSL